MHLIFYQRRTFLLRSEKATVLCKASQMHLWNMPESFAAYGLAAILFPLDLRMGRDEILEEKLMDRIKSYLESFSSLAHYLFLFPSKCPR